MLDFYKIRCRPGPAPHEPFYWFSLYCLISKDDVLPQNRNTFFLFVHYPDALVRYKYHRLRKFNPGMFLKSEILHVSNVKFKTCAVAAIIASGNLVRYCFRISILLIIIDSSRLKIADCLIKSSNIFILLKG